MLTLYIKSRGTGVTKISVNTDIITVETYVQQGKQLKTNFSYMGQNVKKHIYFGLFEGPWGGGGLQLSDWHILLSSYARTHIYVHVK